MVNPLLILPILNASLSTTTHCWDQIPGQESQFTPLISSQCRQAIAKLNVDATKEGRKPLTFGRSEDVGFEVPESWNYASCNVTIDMVSPDVMETATFATILRKTWELIAACVNRPPFLGGEAFVGDHHLIKVSIHGEDTGMAWQLLLYGLVLTLKGVAME